MTAHDQFGNTKTGRTKEWTYDTVEGERFVVKRRIGKGQRCWRDPSGVSGPYLPLDYKELPPDCCVVITEGERARDAVHSKTPFAVTTWCGGAGSVLQTDWTVLAGRDVILWPDRDEPGFTAMEKLAGHLFELGCTVAGVEPPDGPLDGWDAADATWEQAVDLLENAPDFQKPAETQVSARSLDERMECWAVVEPTTEARYLVKGVMDTGTLIMIYGDSGSGKSFFTMDLIAHISHSAKWRGHRTSGGRIVYVAGEGGEGVRRRIKALRIRNPAWDFTNLDVVYGAVNLTRPDEVHALIAKLHDNPPTLIVFDTLARCTLGMDENSAQDMGIVIEGLDKIRTQLECATLVVHHSGKDKSLGARGSSALRAAVDTEVEITAKHEIKFTKQKDLEAAKPMFFELETIDLGPDNEGDARTTAFVRVSDKPDKLGQKLDGKQKAYMRAMTDAIVEHGSQKHGSDLPDCKVVTLDQWKAQCIKHGAVAKDIKEDSQRRAFERIVDNAVKAELVIVFDSFVWPIRTARTSSDKLGQFATHVSDNSDTPL